MKLDEIRNRIKRIVASSPAPAEKQPQRSAEQARGDRAGSVIELRKEVRALQQEISDLTDAGESGGIASVDTAHEAKLASLQSRLAQKQAELAKFQARV